MTKLKYIGQRPLKLNDKRFGVEYDFTGKDNTTDVEDAHADVLMRENPRAFVMVSRTGQVLTEAPAEKPEEDEEIEVEIDDGPGEEGGDDE